MYCGWLTKSRLAAEPVSDDVAVGPREVGEERQRIAPGSVAECLE
jgi:hypothetical protein